MFNQKHILVVDDNEINREMLEMMLSEEYDIITAENGQEALDILRNSSVEISIILLDIIMPVMDGYAFLDEIKKDDELSLIPVIVMTQADAVEDEIAALTHGATDYVRKPYTIQVVKHRVASIINLRETAAMVNQFMYDRLTGMYTKEYFYKKVREILDENPDTNYAIACSNIENFKFYNDVFGRKTGDKLLIEAANVFRREAGPDAVCCRYAADRFLAFAESENEETVSIRLNNAISDVRMELLEDMIVDVGVYNITDRGVTIEQMCDRVFLAVDSIKGVYDRNVVIYNDELRNRLLREKSITEAVETAMEEEQFAVYFQPKYDLKTGEMVGAEALARWIHPEWGFMSPGEFIPLFEKNGFIKKFDEYIRDVTCRKIREWIEKGYSMVPVSVNVSRANVYSARFADGFCKMMKKYNLDPMYLHIEITESAYTENVEQIVSAVKNLRENGFRIELDDFGQGYSSLSVLSEMPLDVMKLDMGFVRSNLDRDDDNGIIGDVVNMAHRMSMKVVAEGVETLEQANQLEAMGCDFAQGYYFSRPVSADDFEKLLIERKCIK
ncbi:MAG: EAL domain-containing protein [Firmicutes bacterium]|nr:EAL domain-containing protein [Bacillota bacterium]